MTVEREPLWAALEAIRSGGLCGPCLWVLPVTGVAVSTLSGPIHTETVCATDGVAFAVEEAQFDLGEGPGWEAFASGRPVLVPDLAVDPEPGWPVFAAAVQSLSVRAVFAFPLYVGSSGVGVLDCYRATPGLLDPVAVREAGALADTVAEELLRRVLAADDPDRGGPAAADWSDRWRQLPQDRRQIHQATGMVMAQLDLPVGAAYARLRGHAFAAGVTLAAAAAAVVTGGYSSPATTGDARERCRYRENHDRPDPGIPAPRRVGDVGGHPGRRLRRGRADAVPSRGERRPARRRGCRVDAGRR